MEAVASMLHPARSPSSASGLLKSLRQHSQTSEQPTTSGSQGNEIAECFASLKAETARGARVAKGCTVLLSLDLTNLGGQAGDDLPATEPLGIFSVADRADYPTLTKFQDYAAKLVHTQGFFKPTFFYGRLRLDISSDEQLHQAFDYFKHLQGSPEDLMKRQVIYISKVEEPPEEAWSMSASLFPSPGAFLGSLPEAGGAFQALLSSGQQQSGVLESRSCPVSPSAVPRDTAATVKDLSSSHSPAFGSGALAGMQQKAAEKISAHQANIQKMWTTWTKSLAKGDSKGDDEDDAASSREHGQHEAQPGAETGPSANHEGSFDPLPTPHNPHPALSAPVRLASDAAATTPNSRGTGRIERQTSAALPDPAVDEKEAVADPFASNSQGLLLMAAFCVLLAHWRDLFGILGWLISHLTLKGLLDSIALCCLSIAASSHVSGWCRNVKEQGLFAASCFQVMPALARDMVSVRDNMVIVRDNIVNVSGAIGIMTGKLAWLPGGKKE